MKLKLFGKDIFEWSKDNQLFGLATSENKESDIMPNFYDFANNPSDLSRFVSIDEVNNVASKLNSKDSPKKSKREITPKEVYNLKTLNETSFILKTDAKYVDEQIIEFKEKLRLIKQTKSDYRRGVQEVASILLRMENRKKYKQYKEFFEEFPYTTTAKIAELIKNETHLKMDEVAQFMADMPKEATKVMKDYTDTTMKLCNKKPIFYIIANKKDFEKTKKRRDPILLAQSPFGHLWQICGAWDEEMLLVDEL